jgi:hypothetical protein
VAGGGGGYYVFLEIEDINRQLQNIRDKIKEQKPGGSAWGSDLPPFIGQVSMIVH